MKSSMGKTFWQKIFISIVILFSLSPSLYQVQASGAGWYYTDNFKALVGPFNTDPECEAALNTAKQASPFAMSFGPCVSKTIVELPPSANTTPPVDVNAVQNASPDNTYNLLAPIYSLKSVSNSGTCPTDSSASNGIGCYLNLIFKIGIGLCGALAVIMIIIGGVQYMGTESVFGKTEAKGRIFAAILGLFIALGAFALLNTINPDLTGQNGVNVDQVEATIERTSGGGYYGVEVGTAKAGNPNATKNVNTYDSFLKAASQKYGVQCTLIKAFMYAESGGVNNLTSPAGAKGLIQLMPQTFQEQGYDSGKMMDPATNIMAGASYLSKLQKNACNGKASSNVCNSSRIQFMAASYNGGPRANKESTSCPGQTAWQCTQNSGYKETRVYAPRVEANFNKLNEKGWGC